MPVTPSGGSMKGNCARSVHTARHRDRFQGWWPWQYGEFSHLVYVQAVAPTGHWEQYFAPITGFYRPGVDTGWAFTWTDRTKKLQLNGAVGVTFNVENTATNYQSGDDFHFEW